MSRPFSSNKQCSDKDETRYKAIYKGNWAHLFEAPSAIIRDGYHSPRNVHARKSNLAFELAEAEMSSFHQPCNKPTPLSKQHFPTCLALSAYTEGLTLCSCSCRRRSMALRRLDLPFSLDFSSTNKSLERAIFISIAFSPCLMSLQPQRKRRAVTPTHVLTLVQRRPQLLALPLLLPQPLRQLLPGHFCLQWLLKLAGQQELPVLHGGRQLYIHN